MICRTDHTTVFGPGEPNEIQLASSGGFDVLLASYDPAGHLLWGRQADGPEDHFAGAMLPVGDALLLLGTVRASAHLSFQPGWSPVFESTGLSDVFVTRFEP